MKKFIIFLLFMPQLFYGQWVQQVSGTTENLNDVFAVTENLVFAVGDNGTILKTTDGGVNWVQKNSGVTFRLDKLQFVNENVGYIFGFEDSLYLGKLLMTVNGGETWSQITSLNINGEGDISVVNADIFYYSNNFILFKSINRGLSFQEINITNSIQEIQFITEMIGFALGYGGLLKTIDGGFTWGIISNSISSFYFLNQNIGFKASSDGLYKTIDGGISFSFVDWDISGMNKIYLSNENIVWGTPVKCPLNGNPCFSMRGETNNLGVYKRENDVTVYTAHSFVNPTLGFAVSWGGQIYKNTTVSLLINKLDKKSVFRITPNPATNQINISLNDWQSQTITIIISDSLGKKVFSNTYNYENNITIDTQNLSKGMYFLNVISENSKQTQKIIIN